MQSVVVSPAKSFSLAIDSIATDKSISHRCVMFAMLSEGRSVIRNFLRAEDTLNSLEIVKNLGAKVEDDGEVITIESNGICESFEVLDCGNSGTGMRLFCGLLSSANGHFVLTGDKYLRSRPMKRVTKPLRSIGAKIDGREEGEYAPLSIRGGALEPFDYVSTIASAQVKSAMILAGLHAKGVCRYTEPELSRDHTERMLKGMGAKIETDEHLRTTITPLEGLLQPLDITVPSDPSSAFFFAVAAAITPNAKVVLKGVTLNPTRIEAFKVLEQMGARITYELKEDKYEPIGDITVQADKLEGVEVSTNISWLIDELPVLSIAMAMAKGKSVVKNAKELRVKESDRIATVVTGLKACGIEVVEYEDGYEITGSKLQKATINSHGDHRIAMSFIIGGLVCGMEVEDIECINTSFPNFFTILEKITTINKG